MSVNIPNPGDAHRIVLEARHVQKQYGSVVALADASIEVRAGEVIALLGPNGAGKSTMVGLLSGRIRADAGELLCDGEPISAAELSRQGSPVSVVQQELSIVPTLTVGENVFLGNNTIGRIYGARRAATRARPFLDQAGLSHVDPMTSADRLSVGEQQLVELARSLARNARIIMLDEPTAALSEPEIDRVLQVVADLRDRGHSIIYISHRLDEIIRIADRALIVRDGRTLEALSGDRLTVSNIIELMLGRQLGTLYPPKAAVRSALPAIRLENVVAEGIQRPLSLTINQGEIFGLAGQLGSAAAIVLEVLAGVRPLRSGTIHLNGRAVTIPSPRSAAALGIAYCSEDRKRDGFFGVRSVTENLTAPALSEVSSGGWISHRRERELARKLAGAFGVKDGRLPHPLETLSGGNQQKVVLGKWLGIDPRIVLVNEPTRGVDVGARAEIYSYLRDLADHGLTVVMTSTEAEEVHGLADTIASFYRGTLVRTVDSQAVAVADLEKELSVAPVPLEEVPA